MIRATVVTCLCLFFIQCKTTDSNVRSQQGDQLKAAFDEEVAAGRDCAVKTGDPIVISYGTARRNFIASLNSIDLLADGVLEGLEGYRKLKIAEMEGQEVDYEPTNRNIEASTQRLRDQTASFSETAQKFATERAKMAAFARECVADRKNVRNKKMEIFERYKEKAFECRLSGDFPTSDGLFSQRTKQTGPISFTQHVCNHTFKTEFESNIDYSKLSPSVRNQVQNLWDQCDLRGTLPDENGPDGEYGSMQHVIKAFCHYRFVLSELKGRYQLGLYYEDFSFVPSVRRLSGRGFEHYIDARSYRIESDRIKGLKCDCKDVWPDLFNEEIADAMVSDEDLLRVRTRYADSLKDIEQNLGGYLDFLQRKTGDVLEQTKELDRAEARALQARLKALEEEVERVKSDRRGVYYQPFSSGRSGRSGRRGSTPEA